MKQLRRLTTCLMACVASSLLNVPQSQAASFSADFNTGIPSGINLYGHSLDYDHSTGGVQNSGVLKLVESIGSQQGGAILDDLDNGAVVAGFDVTFDLYIGSGNGADGMSFFFGDFADAAYSEEGPANIQGLTVAFDVFNNGGAIAEAPAIDVKWNNVVLLHRLVGAASTTTGAAPIGSANTIRTQTTSGGAAVYWPVKIHVDTDGTLDLAYNNVVIFTNVPIFRPITEATLGPAVRFGFGARTGGSTDNHFVDNLRITTTLQGADSGQPYVSVLRPVQLATQSSGANPTQNNPAIIVFQDQTHSINTGSITMRYNNNVVTPIVTRQNETTAIVYPGTNGLLPTGPATVNLSYTTTSTPPLTNSFSYSFVVNAISGSAAQANPELYVLNAVDTTKPGFKVKVHQMDINRNPATGQIPNAERQIANGYIDPATGQPYENTVDLSLADASGYFIDEDVINWNETEGGSGGSFPDDEAVPGITGQSVNGTDRYVVSIETILELKTGIYRFGVNSDDGFRLSIGRGPGDVVGTQISPTVGDRGFTDTTMDVFIPKDGFYPVRLMWWETGGGSGAEFFVQDFGSGAKTLINDLTAASPIKAYRESPVTPPYISRTLPAVNYNYAFADQDIVIDVTDGAFAMNAGSAVLTINGVAQNITAQKNGNVTTLTRKSSISDLLPSGANNLMLVYTYTAGGTQTSVTNEWSFNVPAYTQPIPPANKVPASQVSGTGFKVRPHQIDRSRDANQGNGGRYTGQSGGGSNMPRPEIQLANGYINRTNNQAYPNLADLSGANPDGTIDLPEVLNFNSGSGGAAANAGIFNQDSAVPGLPGQGTSGSTAVGLDNTVHEFITYLDLKAGAHILGLNVDDGWLCSSSPNPRDTLGTLLGWRNGPGGQNGNPLHVPNAAFTVLVLEDGIYPFRILFWQGGGGINIEFMSVDKATGTQILVNDTTGTYPSVVANSGNVTSPITAYSTYTGPVRPWVKFSVYPMPTHATLWQNTHQQSGPGPIQVKVGAGNPADIANDEPRFDQANVNLPFGDAVGAILADVGNNSIGMVLDGTSVTPVISNVQGSSDKLVMFSPDPPLASGSTHTAGLVYGGTTNYWTFRVSSYTNVAATVALPSNAADQSARGFRAKVVQAATGSTLANTVARAEAQLAGNPANVAAPGPESDGTYIVPGIINWNVTKNPGGTPAEIGNFQPLLTSTPDDPVPGIPGTGLSGAPRFENIAAEIFAYLDLPAGYQKFGVNGDDGWKVQIGLPGQTDGTILFTRDRGAGARDIPFAFITPQAGLYPVRLVWYQGGGGGNLEFFTYGPNNEKIAVNDPKNPNAVKAYFNASGTTPAPEIAISRLANGSLRLTFVGKLQHSSSLTPPDWKDLSPSSSPFDVAPSTIEGYYRAVAQ